MKKGSEKSWKGSCQVPKEASLATRLGLPRENIKVILQGGHRKPHIEATPGSYTHPHSLFIFLTPLTLAIYHQGWYLSPSPQIGVMAAPWCHRGVTWAQDRTVGSFACSQLICSLLLANPE